VQNKQTNKNVQVQNLKLIKTRDMSLAPHGRVTTNTDIKKITV